MKKLTLASIALLGVSAYVGMSCSSDDNKAASTNPTTGGSATAGTPGSGGGTAQAGGGQGSGTGGANAGGGVNAPTSTGGLTLTDSYYSQGDYHGYCYTVTDGKGSRINPPCATDGNSGPCFTNALCVAGFGDAAGSDYSHWGASIGCNLGQPTGTNTANTPVDVSGKTTVNVSMSTTSTTVPSSGLRIQINVPGLVNDGGTTYTGYFCGDFPSSGSIPLTSLRQQCWQAGGQAFDPATMKPDAITVQVSTVQGGTTPFDFCVATLSIT
jgi:hypothetical protein